MRNALIRTSLVVACLGVLSIPPIAATQEEKKEHFSALVFLPTGMGRRMIFPGGRANVDIYVDKYSSDEETKALGEALLSGGDEALRKQLEKMHTIGRVALVGRVGQFDLKLIRSHPLPNGGRRIIGVSDRPIQFLEAYVSGPSKDYDIGIIEIELKPDKKGKDEGEGTLIYAAKIKVQEGNKVVIENYGADPAKLMAVRQL